jgi:hypothetical protein
MAIGIRSEVSGAHIKYRKRKRERKKNQIQDRRFGTHCHIEHNHVRRVTDRHSKRYREKSAYNTQKGEETSTKDMK